MKRVIVLLLVTMLYACAGLSKKDFLAQIMDKWVGRSADDLVVTNGPPSDVFMLDSGGRVFEYFKRQMVANDSKSGKYTAGKHYTDPALIPNTSGLRQRVRRSRDDACKILLNVAANSIIQSWSKEGDGCN